MLNAVQNEAIDFGTWCNDHLKETLLTKCKNGLTNFKLKIQKIRNDFFAGNFTLFSTLRIKRNAGALISWGGKLAFKHIKNNKNEIITFLALYYLDDKIDDITKATNANHQNNLVLIDVINKQVEAERKRLQHMMDLHNESANDQYISNKLASLNELLTQTKEAMLETITIIPTEEFERQLSSLNFSLIAFSFSSQYHLVEGQVVHQITTQTKHQDDWNVYTESCAPTEEKGIAFNGNTLCRLVAAPPRQFIVHIHHRKTTGERKNHRWQNGNCGTIVRSKNPTQFHRQL